MAAPRLTHEARLDRYAELVVQVGANVQPGQLVEVIARVEHAHVARAVTRAAYERAPRTSTSTTRPAHPAGTDRARRRRRALVDAAVAARAAARSATSNAAIVALTGDAEPELLADLPGERVGKARMIELADENNRQINEQLNNWVVVGVPNDGWADADVRRAGHRRGCGSSSSSACGSTRTIPSLRGATHVEHARRARASR